MIPPHTPLQTLHPSPSLNRFKKKYVTLLLALLSVHSEYGMDPSTH